MEKEIKVEDWEKNNVGYDIKDSEDKEREME